MATVLQELVVGIGFASDTKALEEAKKGGKEAAEKLRQGFVSSATETSSAWRTALGNVAEKADKAAAKVSGAWKAAEKDIRQAGKEFAKFGGVIAGVATATFALVDKVTSSLDATAKAARAAGLGAEEYQRLAFAAERSGLQVEQVGKTSVRLAKTLEETKRNSVTPLGIALQELGLIADDFDGRSYEQQLGIVADALQGVESAQDRARLMATIFGEEAGPKMASLLAEGSEGIMLLGEEAERVGAVIGEDVLSQAEAFQDELTNLKKEFGAVAAEIVKSLLPAARSLLDTTRGLIPVVKAVAEHAGTLAAIFAGQKLVSGIMAGARAMQALGVASSVALGPFGAILAAFAAALPVALELGDALGDLAADMLLGEEGPRVSTRDAPALKSAGASQARPDTPKVTGFVEAAGATFGVGQAGIARVAAQMAKDKAEGYTDAAAEERAIKALGQLATGSSGSPSAGGHRGGGRRRGPRKPDRELVFNAGIEGAILDAAINAEATGTATEEALDAAAASLAAGDSEAVARKAAMDVLSRKTGMDVGKRETDPLLSAMFGEDALPDVPLSKLDRQQMPQVLTATINNNYQVAVNNTIDGARDPSYVADMVASGVRSVFERELTRVSEYSKVVFEK